MYRVIKKRILFAALVALELFFAFLISSLDGAEKNLLLPGGFSLNTVSVKGLIQSVCLIICLFLVFVNYDWGRKIGVGLICIFVVHNIFVIIDTHSLSSIPGLGISLISLFSIEFVARFFKHEVKNSVTDFITGLSNRRQFVIDAKALVETKTHFFLANFIAVNFDEIVDSYGLSSGDMILGVISMRISSFLGKHDSLYRIAGSNFAIIFKDENNPEEKISKIIDAVSEKIVISSGNGMVEKSCYVNMVCGYAESSDDHSDYISIMNNADTALSFSKKSYANKITAYDGTLKAVINNQIELEKLVKESLKNDYFYLVFQPQFKIPENKLRGFETLLRCKKPDGSFVSPADFIPAAEKSDLILEIDNYVLRKALSIFKKEFEETEKRFIISVNVSAKNISSRDFVLKIKEILKETQFPAEYLEIEITEYSLAESLEITVANIKELRQLGIQIALDDFGTGYTAISQLLNLPVSLLKIDKSLIDDIEINSKNRDLVNSVIYMGHIMNCEVISEGVETEAQLNLLNEHKCDFVQGYILGKPMSFDDARKLYL